MKTKENFFKGFPVVWNMVVFTLFVIEPGEYISFAVVIACAVFTFVPMNFLHPVRVKRLRWINLPMCLLWCAFGAIALFQNMDAEPWLKVGVAITAAWLFLIGGVMQIFPQSRLEEGLNHVECDQDPSERRPRGLKVRGLRTRRAGQGELLVRHTAVGLNFLDVYYRTGLYPAPALPFTPGNEAAGIVEKSAQASRVSRQGTASPTARPRSAPTRRRASYRPTRS